MDAAGCCGTSLHGAVMVGVSGLRHCSMGNDLRKVSVYLGAFPSRGMCTSPMTPHCAQCRREGEYLLENFLLDCSWGQDMGWGVSREEGMIQKKDVLGGLWERVGIELHMKTGTTIVAVWNGRKWWHWRDRNCSTCRARVNRGKMGMARAGVIQR